jgi:molybdate transport system substrate-binding protein
MDLTRIIRELRAELGMLLEIIRTVEELAYGKPVTKVLPTHTRKSRQGEKGAGIKVAFVIAALIAMPAMLRAQLQVIVSGGFSAAFRELSPEFEKSNGVTIVATPGASQGNGPNTIAAQLHRGVTADVVILSREGLDELKGEGRLITGTDTDLAQTPLGLSVRAAAPKPDIQTVEAFKQVLLDAKSVTFPNSTTGIYLKNILFPRLGIADRMAPKITNNGVAAVARGEAEIAIEPVSELLHVTGTEFVGTIPSEAQYISVFAAAVVSTSKKQEISKRLVAFLASENAADGIRKSGMEPPQPRR